MNDIKNMHPYIVSTPETCFGKPRIAGTRMTVQFLATLIDHPDWSMDTICKDFGLTPAQVYAAWSYYYDHKSEIDAKLEESRNRKPKVESKLKKRLQAEKAATE